MPLIPWMPPWETDRRPEDGRGRPARGLPWGLEAGLFGGELFRSLQSFPPVEVEETEAAYLLTLSLPGFERNQIELTIDGNVLTVRCKQDEIFREERVGCVRQERRMGSFVCRIPLPDDIQAEGIRSEFDKGVLRVAIPRTGRSAGASRRIEIS